MSAENLAVGRPARRVDGPEAWFRLVVAVILGTVGAVGMWAVVVVLPSVQAEFGVARADASMPYTATMVGFALGNFIVGRYVDRLGITIPVIAAALMLGSGLVLAAYTTDIWQFTIIQGVLVGLGTSATFGPLMASISHWFERRRGIAVAAAASGNYLAGTIWPIFIQQSVATEGWRTTYIAIGIICVLVMIPLSLLLRGKPPESTAAPADQAMPMAGPRVSAGFSPTTLQVLLIIAGISCCVAMSMPQVHIVAYGVDLGYGPAAGAEMLSIMLGAGVISRLISGLIADYIGGVKTVILGSVLQCIALTLFLPFDGLVSLYVVSLLFGLSQGGIVPSYAIIVREYLPAREAGQRVGLVVMSTVLGMAIGGWMSGWIFDQTGSYAMAFFNGIAWNVLNISIMLMLLWRARRPQGAAA
ncbi:MAG: MFS transporter [Pseudomonadota bacterium]